MLTISFFFDNTNFMQAAQQGTLALQNALREALTQLDGVVDFSYLDRDGDNVVDMVTVRSFSSFICF